MGTSRTGRGLLRLRVLSCLAVLLLYSTGAGVAASRRGLHPSSRHTGAHHRPLTDEQRADQNVQFMLSLYRSAAEPDGRPKQHRKFGSNTVRLLRPSVSSVLYLPASGGEGAGTLRPSATLALGLQMTSLDRVVIDSSVDYLYRLID